MVIRKNEIKTLEKSMTRSEHWGKTIKNCNYAMYWDGPLNYFAQRETTMPKMIRTVLLSSQLTYVNTCNLGLFFKDIYRVY